MKFRTFLLCATCIFIVIMTWRLSNIFDIIKFELVLPIFLILLVLLLYAYIFFDFASHQNLYKYKIKFFKVLDNKFEKDQIHDIQDIYIIYNSTLRNAYNYPLINLLEDYIVHTSENEKVNSIQNYTLIKEIIKEEYKEKPFANTPLNERQLLINISNCVSDNNITDNDVNTIQYNLKELSNLLSEKERVLSRTITTNRWSVPTAIIGIILTVIFGIMSLFWGNKIDYDKIKETTSSGIEDYHNINNENSSDENSNIEY